MRVGEKARFLCMPEYTEGYVQLAKVLKQERENRINVAKGLPVKTIGGGCCAHSFQEEMNAQTDLAALHGAPLEFEIELIDVQTPNSFTKEPWEMSMMEKFREAPVRKDEGGRLYKEGKYQEALDKYTRALALLESVAMSPEVQDMGRPDRPSKLQGTSSPSKSKSAMAAPAQNGDSTTKEPEIDLSTLEALLQSCRLNYAACKIKLNDFAPVIPACTEVLKTDSENVKAIFRRGQAYSRVGRDLDLAQSDFAKLEDILERKAVPKSGSEWTELRREQQILQGKLKAHTQKEKKMFGRMFA
ncbi:uncharacterized protein EV422DRAFT_495344 [Fimicolochytrium jonesii]|uniref:uncharacterized protein n=1 Tax=Fimicolochytrium jonesii TaxID=1396493 RepID=UPI0022FE72F6|nr:uncharacterized protein EV422DRAFT_495344 [Fimicolochytrium jonesii]KAI8821631.1 hypothetical protein EV422DRAFT_495344 [Fimicolochytrium jonesii]